MEFYLVDDKPFELSGSSYLWVVPNKLKSICSESFTLEPASRIRAAADAQNYYCLSLLDSLSASNKSKPALRLKWLLHVPSIPSDVQQCRIQICSTAYSRGYGEDIFEGIKQVCGEDNVRLNFKLNKLDCYDGVTVDDIEAKDLPIRDLTEGRSQLGYGCELSGVNIPDDATLSCITGRLTVSIKLTQNGIGSLFLHRCTKSNLVAGNKRLLEDAVCSDLVIVAANGKKIKCHKGILAVHSDVFQAMFEKPMKESITSVVEMPDMSEPAVRAFLAFIYSWDIMAASETCDIALELLVAADKYNVSDLLSAIAELIVVMSNEWFNVDMAARLLIFTEKQRGICDNKNIEQLQEKAIRVVKSYTKDSFDILVKSEVYQQLFRNDLTTLP